MKFPDLDSTIALKTLELFNLLVMGLDLEEEDLPKTRNFQDQELMIQLNMTRSLQLEEPSPLAKLKDRLRRRMTFPDQDNTRFQ